MKTMPLKIQSTLAKPESKINGQQIPSKEVNNANVFSSNPICRKNGQRN